MLCNWQNGEIEWISEEGFEKLKRFYPKIVNEKPKRFLVCKKKGARARGKVDPWHSVKPEAEVYHNHTDCNTGNNIESEYRRPGTGGRRLCIECKGLR